MKTEAAALREPLAPGSLLPDLDGHLSLYVRLARLMRQKIRSGEWKPGKQIPTLPELCRSFGASRPCVRQAIGLLTHDGLLTSTRGRGTFVAEQLVSILDDRGLRVSISDPLTMGSGQTIKILGRRTVAALPPEIASADPYHPQYVVVTKTHGYCDKPFAAMRIYAARLHYDTIPAGLDTEHKIVPLLLRYTGLRPVRYRQEITIVHATEEVARQLDLPVGSTMVQIRRWWTEGTGHIAWATFGQYRSDMFVLDVTLQDTGGDRLPAVTPPIGACA